DAWAAGLGRPLCVLFGVVAGKQVAGMLAPLRRARAVVLTRPPSPRGRDPREVAALLAAASDASHSGGANAATLVVPDVAEALAAARAQVPPGGVLLVYGSIFLIAEVRRLLLGEAADPVPLQDPPIRPQAG